MENFCTSVDGVPSEYRSSEHPIEKAARAMYRRDQAPPTLPWDEAPANVRNHYRELAEAAVETLQQKP